MTLPPSERAKRAADAMWAADKASAWLGMSIQSVREGEAELTMTVAPHHTNGLDICHGGFLFTLADSAFAFACNSRNQMAVAQSANINFLAPARLGDQLIARAREVSLRGRTGLYDVSLVTETGTLIAEFRGQSRLLNDYHFEENS